jgi:glutamate N-acetyltransferase / amino-acid N-acetyltransferase
VRGDISSREVTARPAAARGVTAPRGFRASGVAAGIKPSGAPDVALVVNDGPELAAAAVLTRNRVRAAPVAWTEQAVADGLLRAVVLNSGGANACTGQGGSDDTAATASLTAQQLGCAPDEVAVCSTGLIGTRLPMDRLGAGIVAAVKGLDTDGGDDAAAAILTTDSRAKTSSATGGEVTVSGMAKGAGMLAPGLATMLAVITTDASVAPATLDAALRAATTRTFDRLDSDGCMSTNDTVVAMASGASEVMVGRDLDEVEFTDLLTDVCRDLALQLLSDAEGASKQIEVRVTSAGSESDAVDVARAVARSNLFKCAIHGEDPNWGRVLAAVGTTAAVFDADDIAVAMNGVSLVSRGAGIGDAAHSATVDLSAPWVVVEIDLGAGSATGWVWTNDLTAAYVHENSAYSS